MKIVSHQLFSFFQQGISKMSLVDCQGNIDLLPKQIITVLVYIHLGSPVRQHCATMTRASKVLQTGNTQHFPVCSLSTLSRAIKVLQTWCVVDIGVQEPDLYYLGRCDIFLLQEIFFLMQRLPEICMQKKQFGDLILHHSFVIKVRKSQKQKTNKRKYGMTKTIIFSG